MLKSVASMAKPNRQNKARKSDTKPEHIHSHIPAEDVGILHPIKFARA